MSLWKKFAGLALCGLLIAGFAACDVFDDDDDASTGNLSVMIHDAPSDDLQSAFVTFSALELRQVGGDWVGASGAFPLELDLLTLVNGTEAELGNGSLPAGQYDAMRATISGVRVVLVDTTEIDVPLPGGSLSTEVASFPVITIDENGALTVTLDFPVDSSFTVNGTTITFSPSIIFEGSN
ncbi:DUF4382 domain-containing protein [Moorena bouillonii]|uniref:DUF4382 domain-containing protein n=1 Tax=Moorena bouillonii PNG TaxID=568701 RepID=A0A1U7N0X5_9CYAN|nr:DUF4382 domain-containing protein [Moorena bouillonii]ANM28707.1 hypothetical protein ABI59_02415 [Acidobacteria bacterium Mor1]OLT59615.1 hypothetical protein BJP37_11845 [Moorena bouillonii PNG]